MGLHPNCNLISITNLQCFSFIHLVDQNQSQNHLHVSLSREQVKHSLSSLRQQVIFILLLLQFSKMALLVVLVSQLSSSFSLASILHLLLELIQLELLIC